MQIRQYVYDSVMRVVYTDAQQELQRATHHPTAAQYVSANQLRQPELLFCSTNPLCMATTVAMVVIGMIP